MNPGQYSLPPTVLGKISCLRTQPLYPIPLSKAVWVWLKNCMFPDHRLLCNKAAVSTWSGNKNAQNASDWKCQTGNVQIRNGRMECSLNACLLEIWIVHKISQLCSQVSPIPSRLPYYLCSDSDSDYNSSGTGVTLKMKTFGRGGQAIWTVCHRTIENLRGLHLPHFERQKLCMLYLSKVAH